MNTTKTDNRKETERRLYRCRALCTRIANNKKDLEKLRRMDFDVLQHSSVSFVSMIRRQTMRIDPIDAFDAQISMLESYIAADEYEVTHIRRALSAVRDDPYYMLLEYRYFRRMSDEEAGEKMGCSVSTVRRNRGRLLQTVTDVLYGVGGAEGGEPPLRA